MTQKTRQQAVRATRTRVHCKLVGGTAPLSKGAAARVATLRRVPALAALLDQRAPAYRHRAGSSPTVVMSVGQRVVPVVVLQQA